MESLFYALGALVLALMGGIIFRWRGGGEPKGWGKYMPRPVDQILFSAVYYFIAFSLLPAWPAAILSAVTTIMVIKGHGRNMDLGTADEKFPHAKPEWYEPIIIGLYGKIPNRLYDALGLFVSGVTYTAPLGLFVASPGDGLFWAGIGLALSGGLKAPAYIVGRWLDERLQESNMQTGFGGQNSDVVRFDGATSYGEFFTGFLLWGYAAFFIFTYCH